MRAAAKPFVLAAVLLAWPMAAHAQDEAPAGSKNTIGPCRKLGLNVWGVSYHVNRNTDYDEQNWGAGLTCYGRPDLKWLGRDENNRVFFEGDALINSWRGLVFPLSLGVDYTVKNFAACRLSFIAALTVAYYQLPDRGISEVRWGPLPGFALGCGHVRTNMILVPNPSKQPLAAVVASMSVLF
jgi:hypothetical protein